MNAVTVSRPGTVIVPMPIAGDTNRRSLRKPEGLADRRTRFPSADPCARWSSCGGFLAARSLHVFRFLCGMLRTHDHF